MTWKLSSQPVYADANNPRGGNTLVAAPTNTRDEERRSHHVNGYGQDPCQAFLSVHTGTHQGDFMGIPPTGKHVTVTANGIYTCQDGKLVENRVVFDALGLLQQLGVVPAPGTVVDQ